MLPAEGWQGCPQDFYTLTKVTSEKELILRLRDQKQKSAAFEELVRMYQERLYVQIRNMVGTHEDADDVLQNTFMKAWAGIDSFREESQIGTWLYRIAANESISFLTHKRQEISLDAESSHLLTLHCADTNIMDGEELEVMLIKAIDTLPPKQRQVFTMKYFQEMKYEEMSDILGTSVGALKASYHHAVEKITNFFHLQS